MHGLIVCTCPSIHLQWFLFWQLLVAVVVEPVLITCIIQGQSVSVRWQEIWNMKNTTSHCLKWQWSAKWGGWGLQILFRKQQSLKTKQRPRVTVWPYSSSRESGKSDSGITGGDKEGDWEEFLAEITPRPKPLSDILTGKDLSTHPPKKNPNVRFLYVLYNAVSKNICNRN